MNILRTLTLLIMTASVAIAEPPKAVDQGAIKDKVTIARGQEFAFKFKREGDKLLEPAEVKLTEDQPGTARIKLDVTTASPFPGPKGATRPYLQVENHLDGTLQYRVLIRNKGSKDFFEIAEGVKPVPTGEAGYTCWGFDSLIEEVVLFEFTISQKGEARANDKQKEGRRFKGVELYSWKDKDGTWLFVLADGTNRQKDEEEVKTEWPRFKGTAELVKALSLLAEGENVFWSNHRLGGFEFPPKDVQKEIEKAARTAKLDFTIDD